MASGGKKDRAALLGEWFEALGCAPRRDEALDALKSELPSALRELAAREEPGALAECLRSFAALLREERESLPRAAFEILAGLLESALVAAELRTAAGPDLAARAGACAALFSSLPVQIGAGGAPPAPFKGETALQKKARELFAGSAVARHLVELFLGEGRVPLRRSTIKLLSVEGDEPSLFVLRLLLLPGGSGSFYPDPEHMALAATDSDFRSVLELAWKHHSRHLPKGTDVAWRISRLHEESAPARFEGSSAGAAFALALERLTRFPPLDRTCAVTGALDPGDPRKIGAVCEVPLKVRILLEAPRTRGSTTVLIVPAANERQAQALDADPRRVRVRTAATLDEAAHLMTRGVANALLGAGRLAMLWAALVLILALLEIQVFFPLLTVPGLAAAGRRSHAALSEKVVLYPVEVQWRENYRASFLEKCIGFLRELNSGRLGRPGAVFVDSEFPNFPDGSPEGKSGGLYSRLAREAAGLCRRKIPLVLGVHVDPELGAVERLERLPFYRELSRLLPPGDPFMKYGLVNVLGIRSAFSGGEPDVLVPLSWSDGRGEVYLAASLLCRLALTPGRPWSSRDEVPAEIPRVFDSSMYLLYPGEGFRAQVIVPRGPSGGYAIGAVALRRAPVEDTRKRILEIRFPGGGSMRPLQRGALDGRCVIVGRVMELAGVTGRELEQAGGELDLRPTPIGRMPGMAVHGIALSQLLQGRYAAQLESLAYVVLSVVLLLAGVLLGALLARRTGKFSAWALAFGLYLLYFLWAWSAVSGDRPFCGTFTLGIFLPAGYLVGFSRLRDAWEWLKEGFY